MMELKRKLVAICGNAYGAPVPAARICVHVSWSHGTYYDTNEDARSLTPQLHNYVSV